jgi:hypothetical protein
MVPYMLFADTPPDGDYHMVDYRVFVTNLEAYPDTALLGCIEDRMGFSGTYQIRQNEALEKGYKFNVFRFLGIEKSLLQEFGGINTTSYYPEETELSSKLVDISMAKDSLPMGLVSSGTYIKDEYPLTKDYYYYEISEVNADELTLKLKRREITFDDGSHKTITY